VHGVAKVSWLSRLDRRRTARHPNRSASVRLWWPGCIGPWGWSAWAGRNIRVRSRFGAPVSDFGNYHIHRRLDQALNPPSIGFKWLLDARACIRLSSRRCWCFADVTIPGISVSTTGGLLSGQCI
jgi:hypothetical protein